VKRLTIGIVDYGVGNLASVRHALHTMGYRCRIAGNSEALSQSDLLLLPGVGAFPAAMQALQASDLADILCQQALGGKPVVGICLGMQLLADSSSELGLTAGLGLIPGKVVALEQSRWHIGWNSIEVVKDEPLFMNSDGQAMYFNHSYVFDAPAQYQTAVARMDEFSEPFTVGVHRNNVVGLQFHPEKSQAAGRRMLASVIEGLCRA
jgi:imidazole glycerol phosphate synthase glutamine amidotransferase subunit